ncbi:sensor domain-containing protein [Streptomyces sp. CBMA29]|uniref:sensor domain-containing protein n=1 Tax=Streptomyces sp. CBMA29 TaxID=1896314 RepID=UPI001662079A|nr:sensor domain-containing protein [Streptomyces sp. CBMA29]
MTASTFPHAAQAPAAQAAATQVSATQVSAAQPRSSHPAAASQARPGLLSAPDAERPAYGSAAKGPGPGRVPPGFWRAPFAAVTFREVGYALTSLPIAIAGFVFAVTMFAVGTSLALTAIGVPVLAAMLTGARALGGAERARAGSLLSLRVGEPAPVPAPRTPGRWAAMTARLRDPSAWKALLFQVLMFPWRIASFVLTLTFLLTGWTVALYPAYAWVFPRYVDWPGYRLFEYTSGGVHHAYYLSSPLQIAGASLLGLLLVFLTPPLVRALTTVDRTAIRSLLS